MTVMNDDDLRNLMKRIPRRHASPEFTGRVLARVDETPPSVAGGRRRRWLMVAVAAVSMGLWLGQEAFRHRAERRRSAERLEMMREEYRALAVELEELRSLTSEVEPIVELGGTDQVGFVVDLRRLPDVEREMGRER